MPIGLYNESAHAGLLNVIRAGMVPKRMISELTKGYSDEFLIKTNKDKRKYNSYGRKSVAMLHQKSDGIIVVLIVGPTTTEQPV